MKLHLFGILEWTYSSYILARWWYGLKKLVFFGYPDDPRSSHYGEYHVAIVDSSLRFEHALRGILKNGIDYDKVMKGDELILELL